MTSLHVVLQRQCETKRRFARAAVHRQLSLVCFKNAMSNTQAKSRTGYSILNRRAPIETFEDPALLLWRYSITTICHFQDNRAIPVKRMKRHRTGHRRVFQRIVQELLYRQLDQPSIHRNRRQVAIRTGDHLTISIALFIEFTTSRTASFRFASSRSTWMCSLSS